MTALRALVRHARQQQVSSIFDLLDHTARSESKHMTALIRALTLAVQRSLTSPEREQQRDRWDLAIFGGKGQINFKVLSQPTPGPSSLGALPPTGSYPIWSCSHSKPRALISRFGPGYIRTMTPRFAGRPRRSTGARNGNNASPGTRFRCFA